MRKSIVALLILVILFVTSVRPVEATQPDITFTLLTPIPTTLEVGESAVVEILVESDVPFALANTQARAFEHRGYFTFLTDVATNTDSAVLELTLIGRNSTANLPNGVVLGAIGVGAVFQGQEFRGNGNDDRIPSTFFPFALAIHD